jgi:protoporphyrinogen oxidase
VKPKIAVIIGAGPAGLTAAYELLTRTTIIPVIFEATDEIGGLSRTINYKGNRIDIGGHRFFSKSDRVMQWWLRMMPMQQSSDNTTGPNPEIDDHVMLTRSRLSRIFFLRRFFNYPINLSVQTVKNLGVLRMVRIASSYLKTRALPIKNEKSLEDFFINRFGNELYKTFFKDYTEKVWGVPCTHIKPEWGAQRIKGLSITKALMHAVKSLFKKNSSIAQKNVETSLIDRFLYPKFGPGQMWEHVAKEIQRLGGKLYMNHRITNIEGDGTQVTRVHAYDQTSKKPCYFDTDLCISTMPVKELISALDGFDISAPVRDVASNLAYRDFITVGLLLDPAGLDTEALLQHTRMKDNWVYIQERDVKVGRLQIFNNWSPYMVADQSKTWVGLEYFCNEGDALWEKSDEAFKKFAIEELEKLGLIKAQAVCDATIIRVPKAYPAYFGSYERFDEIKAYLEHIPNLFLIGRNGMHKYNNQDHSMLTAMTLVDNLMVGITSKETIWSVNAEQEYHEEKRT